MRREDRWALVAAIVVVALMAWAGWTVAIAAPGADSGAGVQVRVIPNKVVDLTAQQAQLGARMTRTTRLYASEVPEISGGAEGRSGIPPWQVKKWGATGTVSPPAPGPMAPRPLAPSLLSSFETFDFTNNPTVNGGFMFIPPDPIGAAGPSHVVLVVNCGVQSWTKAGVQVGATQSLNGFFTAASPIPPTPGPTPAPVPPTNFMFDPKVIYDQYSGRFLIVALQVTDTASGDPSNTSSIFVAVSDDSNPTDGVWYATVIDSKLSISGLDRWFDYPGFAVDDKAVYVAGNMFGFGGGGSAGQRLWIINKSPFYSGGVASVSLNDPIAASAAVAVTIQPAHMFGALGATQGTYLVGYSGLTDGTNEFVQVIQVTDPVGTPAYTVGYAPLGNIETFATGVPDAPQLGSAFLIDTGDRRALHAVWRGGQLYGTALIVPPAGADSGQATALWFDADTSGGVGALTMPNQGTLGGEDIAAGTFTFFPSLAVDSSGNIAFGFAASDDSIYPGAYFTGRLAADAVGTNRGSAVLRAGLDFYVRRFGGTSGCLSRNRWGDYSGMSLDPSDGTFWIFNEFAMARGTATVCGTPTETEDGRWRTVFGHFSTASLPVALQRFSAE